MSRYFLLIKQRKKQRAKQNRLLPRKVGVAASG